MFSSPPAGRTRGKLADKQKSERPLSHYSGVSDKDCPTMPPTVDTAAIEKCLKNVMTNDSDFVNNLVTKLSVKLNDIVHKAVADALKPLNEEINSLRGQVKNLAEMVQNLDSQLLQKTDDLQQYQRRNCVRVFGIPEKQGEDTDQLMVSLCKDQLGVDLPVAAICRSHRLGSLLQPRPDGSKQHRPIIVRFVSYRDRRRVFAEKKKLKGSGMVIREDLTKLRLEVFRRATSIFGVRNTWTVDGRVMWIDGDGRRGSATRLEDLPNTAAKKCH